MKELTFQKISTWECGSIEICKILEWCIEHCEGNVSHESSRDDDNHYKDSFAFELESDIVLFTLHWR